MRMKIIKIIIKKKKKNTHTKNWRAKFQRDKTATHSSSQPKIVELIIGVECLRMWWDLIGKRSQCTNNLHYSRILCNYHNQCTSNENKFNCFHFFAGLRQSYYFRDARSKGLHFDANFFFFRLNFSESKWLLHCLET